METFYFEFETVMFFLFHLQYMISIYIDYNKGYNCPLSSALKLCNQRFKYKEKERRKTVRRGKIIEGEISYFCFSLQVKRCRCLLKCLK